MYCSMLILFIYYLIYSSKQLWGSYYKFLQIIDEEKYTYEA